jgi:hypothetical protein
MATKIAKLLAMSSGAFLIVFGLLALIPNPLIGVDGIVARGEYVSWIYVATGLILLAGSNAGESGSAFALYVAGGFHVSLALAAYLSLGPSGSAFLFDVVRIRPADITCHVVLGVLLAIFGKMNTSRQQLFYD